MSTQQIKAKMKRVLHGFMFGTVGLLACATQAAPITWGPATNVVDDSDVSTNGVLQYAEHWGGTDSTVNGVAFTAAGTHVIKSGGETATVAWDQGAFSEAYYGLLRGIWYQAYPGMTVTLNSLEPGRNYQIQIWAMDKRYSTSQYQVIFGGPSLSIGTGQYAVGTFTADAATQVITFGSGSAGIVNAVQVREVEAEAVDPATSLVVASTIFVLADGADTATVTVTLRDSNGAAVSNKVVTLSSSRGATDTISAASGPSSAFGTVTFSVTSMMPGTAVFSATDVTDGNLALTQTAAVKFGTVVVGAQQFSAGDVLPSPIIAVSNDLLETSVSSVTGEIAGQKPRNGTTGTALENSTQDPAATELSTLTYNLNLTAAPRGYDITEIRLFSGWSDGRAGQSYRISYSLAETPATFVDVGTVSALTTATGSLLTRTYDLTGAKILKGVAGLRFTMIDNGYAGSGTVFREFDVLGVKTPPKGTMIQIF